MVANGALQKCIHTVVSMSIVSHFWYLQTKRSLLYDQHSSRNELKHFSLDVNEQVINGFAIHYIQTSKIVKKTNL
jgi:hypothetical protein